MGPTHSGRNTKFVYPDSVGIFVFIFRLYRDSVLAPSTIWTTLERVCPLAIRSVGGAIPQPGPHECHECHECHESHMSFSVPTFQWIRSTPAPTSVAREDQKRGIAKFVELLRKPTDGPIYDPRLFVYEEWVKGEGRRRHDDDDNNDDKKAATPNLLNLFLPSYFET
ncbi:hypothetical protein SODALDRAFT_374375 [Sodiomyces alkalinus F11]|uniref:Uncharacterized protein n=1 Tax=Sodiomyces alkalinus (strain CBS 110278 / VKM F-3762 / F11) TaxID=1314773 RepID=A0A3N2Q5E2_SODAK|nr:hypothetical protein SODALDRAFT_374375 [Sodiomyces alkalinus F11]ROT41993.1 hypothetical protein SODALDRAFT_374375 [Sodiomyces alkalinus F11]